MNSDSAGSENSENSTGKRLRQESKDSARMLEGQAKTNEVGEVQRGSYEKRCIEHPNANHN